MKECMVPDSAGVAANATRQMREPASRPRRAAPGCSGRRSRAKDVPRGTKNGSWQGPWSCWRNRGRLTTQLWRTMSAVETAAAPSRRTHPQHPPGAPPPRGGAAAAGAKPTGTRWLIAHRLPRALRHAQRPRSVRAASPLPCAHRGSRHRYQGAKWRIVAVLACDGSQDRARL